MNTPYDGDRGQPPGGGDASDPSDEDPRATRDAHPREPYRHRDPAVQDAMADAQYDWASHPGPPPGGHSEPGSLHQPPSGSPHAPDPRHWAPTAPAPEQDVPAPHPAYGDQAATTQFAGAGDLISGVPGDEGRQQGSEHDAFAHLYRDQEQPQPPQAPYSSQTSQLFPQPQKPSVQIPQSPGESPQPAQNPQPSHGAPWQQPAPESYGYAAPGPAPQPDPGTAAPGAEPGVAPGAAGPEPSTMAAPGPQTAPPAPPGPSAPAGPTDPPGPAAATTPAAPVAPTTPGKKPAVSRAGSLLRSSAVMAAGTLVSRLTGFVRQLVLIAALGAAVLGDTYNIAMSLPTMIYILTIGGGLNSVFVPQLVRAMKSDEDGGDAYANRLLTLVMVILGGLVVVAVFAAPLLIRLMSVKIADDPAANEVAVTFARYCLPTIFFMGVHVVLGQILNARNYFGPMMWTPVLNNIVVIFTFGMFIWVYGTQRSSQMGVTTITPEGLRLLGVGTLLGLVVQALSMVPYLYKAGFRLRPRFDWRGSGMGKAAKLAKWTVLFVLANQVGLIVVAQLATWAGESAAADGYPGTGFIGYNSALLIWQMPQAIITVSVMAALLPRISRAAADGDTAAVRDDLSHGLRTSAVAIVPIAFAFVALGVPMCTLMFGSSGETSARSIGYILMAFGLGLIPFSAQYAVLRAFYAYEDTRTPFYNTVIVSAVWSALSGLCFVVLPDRWVVAGIGFCYGIAYAIGVMVAWRRLSRRLDSDLDGPRIIRTYARLVGAGLPAALAAGVVAYVMTHVLGGGLMGSLATLIGGSAVLFAIFYVAARRMRIGELTTMIGMVRARLGR